MTFAPSLRHIETLPAPLGTQGVKLFWKIDVDDMLPLKEFVLPKSCEHLEEVGKPRVTLLFFGGREDEKAAKRVGLSLDEFSRIDRSLAAHAGERVTFVAHTIYMHNDVVLAAVSLPSNLLHHTDPVETPYVKFRVNPKSAGDVARTVLSSTGNDVTRIVLPEPLPLSGTIQLEMAPPRAGQKAREPRLPKKEVPGRWVRGKKHVSMRCAVITFPNIEVRDLVLQHCSTLQPLQLRGIEVIVKPHWGKQVDGSRRNMADSLFVGWREGSGDDICVEDLRDFFDQQTAPWMNSGSMRENASLSEELLRGKTANAQAVDAAPERLDDVLVLRLTRMSRSQEVANLLSNSPLLDQCRLRMDASECEIMPEWANGARLFVPIDEEVVIKNNVALAHFHIIAYRCDVDRVKQALSSIPFKNRPKLTQESPPLMLENESGLSSEARMLEQPFEIESVLRTDSSIW